MRCKRIFSIFVILTIVLSLGTCAMASSDKDSIIGAMKNESKENLVPYIELLGFNTTENSLSVSEEFLNNIDRVIIMGLLGTCEHSYSSSANGKIDILEWVSNNEISKNAFLEYISFLNNYFGETATLNSYDNLSDETYHWIDYENLCMVYCWLSDTNQVCIRWYWEEDYVSSLNVTGTVFSDNSKNPSNETKNQEAVSVLSCSSELSSSSYYAVDFKIQNNLEVSIHTITLNVIFTDEEGNTVNATYPQEPQRLRPGKTQVMDALCKVDLFPVKVYIDAISFYDEEENYHKFYLEDPEEFNVIPDAVTATPISTVIPTSAPTVTPTHKPTATPKPQPICVVDNCYSTGTKTYTNPFSGMKEYYCTTHYNEMMDDMEKILSTYCGMDGCSKAGTKKWINFSGFPEYYCEEHYESLMEALDYFGY